MTATTTNTTNTTTKMNNDINEGFSLTTPEQISAYRLITMYHGLKAEVKGFRMTSKVNCFALVKREFGLRGTKVKVLAQFKAMLQEAGILSPDAK
jgi:hypothetical protein